MCIFVPFTLKIKIMRTSLLLLFLSLVITFSFSSCEKKHTCACSFWEDGIRQTVLIELESSATKTAIKDCDNQSIIFQDKEDVSCHLD